MKFRSHPKILLILFLLLLIMITLLSILFGTVNITIGESIKIIGKHIPLIKEWISLDDIKPSHVTIIMNLRLPRTILALFVGMGLSAAGCVYQGVFSNPMADPYLIGVSSGAAFGATVAMLLPIPFKWLAISSVNIMAFIGAISVMLFVFMIAQNKGKLPSVTLILAGIAINYFITSFIALLMLFNKESLEEVYLWTLGSFKSANWVKIMIVMVAVLIGLMIIQRFYLELNMIMINEEQAMTLGVSTEKVKKILLIASSLMVAFIVATCGVIGFVGLITPHGTRLIIGPNHKYLIPFSTIVGGCFTVICDTIARSILANAEISVGIITAIFGVPFFLMLLYKNKKILIG